MAQPENLYLSTDAGVARLSSVRHVRDSEAGDKHELLAGQIRAVDLVVGRSGEGWQDVLERGPQSSGDREYEGDAQGRPRLLLSFQRGEGDRGRGRDRPRIL